MRLCVGTSAALIVCAAAAIIVPDPDLWGHVRFGLDMLTWHELPAVDPYSFTQDVPWINHEWLSELQMGVSFAVAGPAGLSALKAVLLSITAWLLWTAWRGIDMTVRILLCGVLTVALLPAVRTLRPQIWSILAVAVLARLLADARWRRLAWLPLLFAVWANAHGGFVVGLGVLAIWATGAVATTPRQSGHWLLLVLAVLAATLLTPHGVALWSFLLETVALGRPNIDEWQPAWTRPTLLGIWLLATLAVVAMVPRLRANRLATGLALSLLAFAAFHVLRLVPLYVEVLAILLAPALAARWPASPVSPRAVARAEQVVALAIPVVSVVAVFVLVPGRIRCLAPSASWRLPQVPVRRMLETAAPGRLVTFYNWGEYALWHLSPAIRVSMDGRRETVYSQRRIDEHAAILDGRDEGLAELARWNAEYIWLPSSSRRTREWAKDHGYRLDWDDGDSFLAVRADLPVLPPAAAQTGRRCFPE